MSRKKQINQTTAEEEIKFLQNPNALRKHANKVLVSAKEVEAARIAAGAKWKRDKNSKTIRLTFN